ncbi:MAG: DUF5647 family protein [Candidatus Bipolaricaulia bacterium]
MNTFERKNTELIKEFNRYVREHPKVAEQIPNDSVVILQLEGDEEFNAWAHRLAENRRSEGHPVVLVKIKKLKPLRSRIEKLELEKGLVRREARRLSDQLLILPILKTSFRQTWCSSS